MAQGVRDEEWLAKLTELDWAVISKDEHILQRPMELEAHKAARLHMFMLPNNVRRDDLIFLPMIRASRVPAGCGTGTRDPSPGG